MWMNTIEIDDSLIVNNEKQYEGKLYECKNFEFPFIGIFKNEKRNEYYLSFMNENYITEKFIVYSENIPCDVLKLFNLKYEESFKGFLTEITCIQCINT